MISSETPYKFAEIIRDTWPQLYRAVKINEKDLENLGKGTGRKGRNK